MNVASKITAATLAMSGLALIGCDDRNSTASKTGTETSVTRTETTTTNNDAARTDAGTAADRGTSAVADAANRTGDALQNAGAKTGDALKNAADKTGDAMQRTRDRVAGATNDATARPAAGEMGNDANRATGNQTGGGNTAMAPDGEDVQGMLAAATEAFAKKGTFDDLVERFVDADRNRVGKDRYAEQDYADLNAASDAFLAAWKEKYNKDFDIVDEKVVFNDASFKIMQSEVGDNARTAGGAVDVNAQAGDGKATVDVKNNTGVDNPNTNAADANKNDPGRNIATVTVKGAGGMADLQVPLIHEFPDAWKIDVPDSVDGPKLKDNVVAHLNAITAMKAQWPADSNEAYRVVSQHMLMALLDKPVQK